MQQREGAQAIELAWRGSPPNDLASIEAQVRAEIAEIGPSKPENLLFHHVFLTGRDDGPCVIVWGEKGSAAYHCEYHEGAGA